MQLFAIPTGVLAALLFGTTVVGSPIPQTSTPPLCAVPPVILVNYAASNLVTYNPSNPNVDGKRVYLATRIGIPESPPPSPLVIYAGTPPIGTNLLTATLKASALYSQYGPDPAKVYPLSGLPGLSSVFYQSPGLFGNPSVGSPGTFQVTPGCDLNGLMRYELWPRSGRFCVRAGTLKPELELLIKTADYVESKDDPNPCVNVTVVVKTKA